MSLALEIAQLPQSTDQFTPRLNVCSETDQGQGISFGQMDSSTLWHLMHLATAKVPEGDAKLKAAYLIGNLGWSACNAISFLAVNGIWVTDICADAVCLKERKVAWEINGESGENIIYDVELHENNATFSREKNAHLLGACIENIFADIVYKLFEETKLGRSALWRLVADSLAVAMLANGRHVGCEKAAMSIAMEVLQDKRLKLHNKQTGFEWVSLPERPEVGEWMRVRGGCCRHYTLPREDAVYCTTCVLRTPESRIERYREYLRRTIAGNDA